MSRWSRRVRLAVLADPVPAAALAIWLVAATAWLLHNWEPIEDLAITELEVRRVSSDPPLSGSYSSLPFRHPGPALFYWLWPFYELLGRRSSALLAANVALVGAMIAAVLVLARRLSGRILQLALVVGLALWSSANAGSLLLQPWNPYVGAVPTVLLVLLTWAMVERSPYALPAALVVGSWMVQAHIQFGPVVVVLWLLGGTTLIVRRVRAGGAKGLRALGRPVALTILAAGLMWTPVIIDIVANGGESNPAQIVRYYLDEPHTDRIPSGAVEIMMRSQLSLHPTWAGGPRSHPVYGIPGEAGTPWLVPIMSVVGLAAVTRRAWDELCGMAVAVVALVASFWSLSRVTGTFGAWYLIAAEGAGIALFSMLVASVVRTVRAATRWAARRFELRQGSPARLVRTIHPLVAIGTLAVIALTAATLGLPIHERRSAEAATDLLPSVEQAVGDRTVLLESKSGFGGWVHSRLVIELERAGYEVFTLTTLDGKYPADMEATPPADAVRLVVVSNPPADIRWSPGVEIIAETRYRPNPGDVRPLHVVVVTAPLGQFFLSEQG